MKLQKLIVLAAALMAGTAGAATQKATLTPIQDEKKKEQHSSLYHFARMVITGSLSGLFAGAAVHGFDKLMKTPYEWTKIDANKAAGDKNSYLGGYPSKVLFPIAGAFGVWLYCYVTDKDKGCLNDAEEANMLTGLPKKDAQGSHDAPVHCASCSCSAC